MILLRSVTITTLAGLLIFQNGAAANEVVSAGPDEEAATEMTTGDAEARPDRELDSPLELSPKMRSILNLPSTETGAEAFGEGNHPYTTAQASAVDEMTPVDKAPWHTTGKLFMQFGPNNFVCTASVIDRNILVTAAHCIHNFGEGPEGFADAVAFEPARHADERPFGTWIGRAWYAPQVYVDGTDVCSDAAPGVVCENDVAVVVVDPNEGGENIADVVGRYKVTEFDEFGYAFFLGQRAAHFTQLGYPSKDFDGDKMMRTDSMAIWDDPNNVVWGSNQTGGSSGGPELQNFGTLPDFVGPPPSDADPNIVSAVTSWGFTSGTVKVQGASRFSKNTAFTEKSNIQTLWEVACDEHPDACGD